MKTYQLTEARRRLPEVLDRARRDGAARIRTRDLTYQIRVRIVGPSGWNAGKLEPRPATIALLKSVERRLAPLPSDVRAALRAYAAQPVAMDVVVFARMCGMTRRTLDRKIAYEGFDGTARLLKGLAVVTLWDHLAHDWHDGLRVAAKLGHRSRMLSRQINAYVGYPAKEAVRRLTREQVVKRVLAKMIRKRSRR